MSALTAIHRIADPIGFDVGQSDSRVQAELLNGFARGISRGQQRIDIEMQNCYIVEDMTPEAKAYFLELARMIEEVEQ